MSEKTRASLNKILPQVYSLQEMVENREDIVEDLENNILQDYPEIYDIKPNVHYESHSLASNIISSILDWVGDNTYIGEDEGSKERLRFINQQRRLWGRGRKDYEEWTPDVSDVVKKAIKNYPKILELQGGRGAQKKKEAEDKTRRLIESAENLARRLAAPPTGTYPTNVKLPVQQTKPAQPKIPAPRATVEQPTEQGKGLSNLTGILPAIGRRLPFIAPAATLLRSKPVGEGSDVVPSDPLGTGRVYRNYHDYNPRNI